MKEIKTKYDREFQGTLITGQNYKEILEKEGRDGVRFHAKHLLAYKRGQDSFAHGIDKNGFPIYHRVQQKLFIVE